MASGTSNRTNGDNPFPPILNHRNDPEFHKWLVTEDGVTCVANVMMSRGPYLGRNIDPRRDYEKEFGYPARGEVINYDDYLFMFQVFSIAARVVEVFAREAWQVHPLVYEDEDEEVTTPFEDALANIDRMLNIERSWFASTETGGSALWRIAKEADELSGIGQYGVILYGFADTDRMGRPKDLHEPVDSVVAGLPPDSAGVTTGDAGPDGQVLNDPRSDYGVASQYPFTDFPAFVPRIGPGGMTDIYPSSPTSQTPTTFDTARQQPGPTTRLLYMRPLPEGMATVVQWETNKFHPRFGLPVMYNVTLNDPTQGTTGNAMPTGSYRVHWSRITHLADTHHTATTSRALAAPRQRPVWADILNCYKVGGASAEMYYQGALPGHSFEVDPRFGQNIMDEKRMKDVYELWRNGMQRGIITKGWVMKDHAPQVVDPTPQLEKYVENICIKLNMPMRIFKGSERGNLASEQDETNWAGRKRERRTGYMTSGIVCPIINRLILARVLPEPMQDLKTDWPDFSTQTEEQKAKVSLVKTQSLAAYVSSGADVMVTPMNFLTKYQGFSNGEAKQMLEDAAEANQQREEMQRDLEEEAMQQQQEQMEQQAKLQQQSGNGAGNGGSNRPPKPPPQPQSSLRSTPPETKKAPHPDTTNT
jgi:hypothetical protein